MLRPYNGIAVLIILTLALFMFSGCQRQGDLAGLGKDQKEILAKLEVIEKNQQELKKGLKAQTEIMARLVEVEKNQKEMARLFQPKRPSVDPNKVHNLPVGSSAIKGKKEAPVTIVEFSDFQCTYCSRLQQTLKQVLNDYPDDVRLVFKDFPLPFHKQAMNAARAARAAGEQGKYWEMHDLLFRDFNKLNDSSYKGYALQLGLDEEKFIADFKSGKYDKLIQQDISLGRTVGVTGTPSLFINGKKLQRRSINDFKTAIDVYLKK